MMSSSSAGSSSNLTLLPLSDPRCNNEVCLAFKVAGDASQSRIPFASQFVYGHYAVYYYSTLILLFSILYFCRRLSAAYEDFPEPKTTVLHKARAIWKFIAYRKLGIGMSFGHFLFIGLAVLFMTVLTFVQKPYFRPRLSYGSPPIGVRTGVMALALTPAIVALSGKYNFVTLMTGISYERLNILHRYLGYTCLGLGIVHSFAFFVAIYGDANYWPLIEKLGSAEYTGVAVMFLLLFITISSIAWIRKRVYEAFASSHIVAYLLYLGFMFWHTANRMDTWNYLYATLVITLLSSFGRLVLKLKAPRGRCSTATIQDIDGEMLKIVIPAFNGMTWKPGQHVYLRFPGTSILENHPFTIASLCEETYVTDKSGVSTRTPMFFLVKSREGLTKRLIRIAQQRTTLKVLIDGPYGDKHVDLSRKYEQVILVAGGSGISAVLPLFSMLCKRMAGVNSTVASVRLIWVIRNRGAQFWVQEELKAAMAMTCPGTVEIDLYVTGERHRAEQLDFSFEPEDIEMQAGVQDGKEIAAEESDEEEQRLIPKTADITETAEGDQDDLLSLDGLHMEMGIGEGGFDKIPDGSDEEDESLMPSHRQRRRDQDEQPDHAYGVDASITYGRPNFQDILPRLLLAGGRVFVVGCGPAGLNIDLCNAVATCQTVVLRGKVRKVSLRTESFGW